MQSEIIDVPDGSAAFPVNSEAKWAGMSLRDWFAAKAMPSVLDDRPHNAELELETAMDAAAKICYLIADAMLRARKAGAE